MGFGGVGAGQRAGGGSAGREAKAAASALVQGSCAAEAAWLGGRGSQARGGVQQPVGMPLGSRSAPPCAAIRSGVLRQHLRQRHQRRNPEQTAPHRQQRGERLGAGDVLNLRHRIHVGPVNITGKHGTPNAPIVIRSFPGEHANIDGTVPQFRRRHNEDWVPARSLEATAAEEELISAMSFRRRSVQPRGGCTPPLPPTSRV
jgi:hypothetical protein